MPETMSEALPALAALGEAWVVGGAVRDALLGAPTTDIDIAATDAPAWAARAGALLDSRPVDLGGPLPTFRLALNGGTLDVVDLPHGLDADLARRDFTISALAVPLPDFAAGRIPESVIDRHGGLADLQAGRLEIVSDSAIGDEPIRALRGVRLEATRNLRLTQRAERAIRAAADRAAEVAPERTWAELSRIFDADTASDAVRRLEQLGLLTPLFPELDACRGVDQRPIHRRDVFNHQLDALEYLDGLIADAPRGATAALHPPLWSALGDDARERIAADRRSLRIAVLLHDAGKPGTRTVGEDGRAHFYGHSELGADLATARLRRLRAPRRLIDRVERLIAAHLRPGMIASPGAPPTERALYRFHRDLGRDAAPLCLLFLADALATVGPDALAPRWNAYVAHVSRIIRWQPRRAPRTAHFLSGTAVMDATGLAPGPEIGRILAALDEAAALGEITTPDAARERARELAAPPATG